MHSVTDLGTDVQDALSENREIAIIPAMTRTSGSRRFVQVHLATLLAALLLVGGLNYVADPFDYFRPDLRGTLDPYKKRSATRYARANAVASGDWDVIFCGASRTEIGFDPEHPALAGQRVYNFGLVAAKAPEIWAASRFALESNPSLRTLWIELDPSYLIHKPPNGDYLNSRYAPRAEPVNYALGQLLGSLTTERSASTLSKWRQGKRTDDYYTAAGLRVRPIRPPRAIPWDWFERELAQTRSQRAAQTAAHRAARQNPHAPWLDLSLLADITDVVALAHRQDTQVCVLVPPSHVVRLAQFLDEGWYQQVNDFKRHLAGHVGDCRALADGRAALVVYDFLVDDDANAEPLPRSAGEDTRWHWEAGHFRVELGNRMIDLIASSQKTPPGAFGAQLTPDTIDDHLAISNAALADRLPNVALIREQMNWQRLAQQLGPSRTRVIAAEGTMDQ